MVQNLTFVISVLTKGPGCTLKKFREIYAEVYQLFLVQHTETGKNVPSNQKIYQMAVKYTK
jgi:hypothetical protein